MFVPFFNLKKAVDKDGNFKAEVLNYFVQLTQQMQQCLGNEGFVPPKTSESDMAIIEPTAIIGTLIFNTDSINGGSSDRPNGQLYIKLADGMFHAMTNL